jgi:hypothetical protein
MSKGTAFAAFGEHAALYVGGIFDRPVVSDEKMSCTSHFTDHWDSHH